MDGALTGLSCNGLKHTVGDDVEMDVGICM